MSNKIIKKAAACGLSAVMAFGLVAVIEAPKTANVSAATKKVKKLSFKKKGYVISAPGHWMNAKTRLKFSPKSAKTYKLKYKTSNKKIATISKNGIIRAKKKGTVTITAIAKNNKKAKGICLNGTYPFLSATLVRQLPYYLFRETCFMDSYPPVVYCTVSPHIVFHTKKR